MARNRAFLTAAFGAPLAILAAPVVAQASLAMLDSLDKGGWELRVPRRSDRAQTVRAQRPRAYPASPSGENCNRFVVQDSADEITVQYTCRGNGYGRTHIRKESTSLIQMDSQGIAGGKPFQFTAEARRTGNCD